MFGRSIRRPTLLLALAAVSLGRGVVSGDELPPPIRAAGAAPATPTATPVVDTTAATRRRVDARAAGGEGVPRAPGVAVRARPRRVEDHRTPAGRRCRRTDLAERAGGGRPAGPGPAARHGGGRRAVRRDAAGRSRTRWPRGARGSSCRARGRARDGQARRRTRSAGRGPSPSGSSSTRTSSRWTRRDRSGCGGANLYARGRSRRRRSRPSTRSAPRPSATSAQTVAAYAIQYEIYGAAVVRRGRSRPRRSRSGRSSPTTRRRSARR